MNRIWYSFLQDFNAIYNIAFLLKLNQIWPKMLGLIKMHSGNMTILFLYILLYICLRYFIRKTKKTVSILPLPSLWLWRNHVFSLYLTFLFLCSKKLWDNSDKKCGILDLTVNMSIIQLKSKWEINDCFSYFCIRYEMEKKAIWRFSTIIERKAQELLVEEILKTQSKRKKESKQNPQSITQ